MNGRHEANRRHWNAGDRQWKAYRDEDELWRRCPEEPDLGFDAGALNLIRDVAGDPDGKDVCVIGSGDNYAVFALAGLGAKVTSVDISERQLEIASDKARQLGLAITFVRADASDLGSIKDGSFDLVCSTNGFFVWITDLQGVFDEVYRILRPGGHYCFYDIHPFQRPWKDQKSPIEVEKPYWETGPFEDPGDGSYVHHWTLDALLNSMAGAGFVLIKILESPANDSRFWEIPSHLPGTDKTLLNWKVNPRAALPVWLTAALLKP